jgi:MFS family permease
MSPFKKIFFSLYMAVFMSSLGLGILSPILPAYVDRFAASSLILGIVFGVYPGARTVFMPFIGRSSDRVGRRLYILAGLTLFTIVSPLYALSGSVSQLILIRFLQGIAAAMLLPVAMSTIGDLSPKGKEGFVMGSFTSAFFAGLGFGPLIGGFLKDTYSVEAAFYGMGVLSLLALIMTLFTLTSEPPRTSPATYERKILRPWQLIKDTPLLGLLLFRFTRAVGIGLVWVILPLYAVRDLGISGFQVGILLSANTFLTTLLQAPIGHCADRIGHVKSLTTGSVIAAIAVAGIGWSNSFGQLIALSIALGLAGSLIVPSGSALAVSLGRKRGMGTVMGLFNSALSFGTMIGPVIGGGLLDLAGVRVVFPAGALLGIAGLGCLLVMYKQDSAECRREDLTRRH